MKQTHFVTHEHLSESLIIPFARECVALEDAAGVAQGLFATKSALNMFAGLLYFTILILFSQLDFVL